MSGSQTPISGRMSRLKPWHFVVIGGVSMGSLLLIPTLSRLTEKKKAIDTTAATLAATTANGGEPWHAPAFPTSEVVPATYKPIMAPAAAAQTGLLAAAPAIALGPSGPPDYRMFGQRQQPPLPPNQAVAQSAGNGDQLGATKVTAAADGSSMASLLKPTETTGYVASRIPHPWATIEQGRIIACNSVTRMTSELAGFVKAKITYDVRSADGTTTLIDRNADIFGEISHGLANGQERLFVLWRSVTTPPPDLVRITLNSPAADELGESGLPGDLDQHIWKRIGGALMLSGIESLMQGGSQALANSTERGNGGSNFGGGGSGLSFYSFQGQGSSLASQLLAHTINIPDTLTRDQALPCSIFVSGDLDFSSVYQLRRRQ